MGFWTKTIVFVHIIDGNLDNFYRIYPIKTRQKLSTLSEIFPDKKGRKCPDFGPNQTI